MAGISRSNAETRPYTNQLERNMIIRVVISSFNSKSPLLVPFPNFTTKAGPP